jgi:hypothetical protein
METFEHVQTSTNNFANTQTTCSVFRHLQVDEHWVGKTLNKPDHRRLKTCRVLLSRFVEVAGGLSGYASCGKKSKSDMFNASRVYALNSTIWLLHAMII